MPVPEKCVRMSLPDHSELGGSLAVKRPTKWTGSTATIVASASFAASAALPSRSGTPPSVVDPSGDTAPTPSLAPPPHAVVSTNKTSALRMSQSVAHSTRRRPTGSPSP